MSIQVGSGASDAAASDQVLLALTKENYTLEKSLAWETLGMRGTCSAGFELKAKASAEQIFPALMLGGRLVLRDAEPWTPARLLQEIRRQRVSVAEVTPALWELVIGQLRGDDPLTSDFRLLVLGGEQVSGPALTRWFERTSVPVHNTYGPTETTITAVASLLRGPAWPVPIGRPISDTTAYVVDRSGSLAPLGVPGEVSDVSQVSEGEAGHEAELSYG